jgi:hypothetical protein
VAARATGQNSGHGRAHEKALPQRRRHDRETVWRPVGVPDPRTSPFLVEAAALLVVPFGTWALAFLDLSRRSTGEFRTRTVPSTCVDSGAGMRERIPHRMQHRRRRYGGSDSKTIVAVRRRRESETSRRVCRSDHAATSRCKHTDCALYLAPTILSAG